MLSSQDAIAIQQQERSKGVDIFVELNLRYGGVVGKVMKTIASHCAGETAKLCSFSTDRKWLWALCGGALSVTGIRVSSSVMIALTQCKAMHFLRRYFTSSSSNVAEFVQALVVEEVKDRA